MFNNPSIFNNKNIGIIVTCPGIIRVEISNVNIFSLPGKLNFAKANAAKEFKNKLTKVHATATITLFLKFNAKLRFIAPFSSLTFVILHQTILVMFNSWFFGQPLWWKSENTFP